MLHTGCKHVFYCTRDHQKSHWGTHKEDCKILAKLPYRVRINGYDIVQNNQRSVTKEILELHHIRESSSFYFITKEFKFSRSRLNETMRWEDIL